MHLTTTFSKKHNITHCQSSIWEKKKLLPISQIRNETADSKGKNIFCIPIHSLIWKLWIKYLGNLGIHYNTYSKHHGVHETNMVAYFLHINSLEQHIISHMNQGRIHRHNFWWSRHFHILSIFILTESPIIYYMTARKVDPFIYGLLHYLQRSLLDLEEKTLDVLNKLWGTKGECLFFSVLTFILCCFTYSYNI